MPGLSSPHSRALLIGTGRHVATSTLPEIPAAEDTVRDMAEALIDRCGLAEANLRVCVDPEHPPAVEEVLTELAAAAEDVLLLHYVGHGVVSPSGELHLATYATRDLTRGLAAYQAMPYSAILDLLAECRAQSIVIVLDCCFAGRAWIAPDRRAGVALDVAHLHGGYLLTASARFEAALAPPGERHTAFTGELIRLLREGDPAGPRDITLDHVYQYLARALPARGVPSPHRQAGDRAGELVLAPNAAYRPPVVRDRSVGAGGPDADVECPYRGLAPYGITDARYFFGRRRLTDLLVSCLAERWRPGPVIVVGPSGSGKSSLLRAGLLPALADGAVPVPGSRDWPALVLTPGPHPVYELATRLAGPAGTTAFELQNDLLSRPDLLVATARTALAGTPSAQLVLIVDQFEELFTTCDDEGERLAFVQALAAGSAPADGADLPAVAVVLSVRADFYGHCGSYPELIPSMEGRQVVVGAMRRDEVRQAIEQPAAVAGLVLETGLVELLLADLGAERASGYTASRLPLLSHALLQTWQHRDGRLLTLAGYQAAGGIRDGVARTAERTYQDLDPSQREVARRLLLRMVQIGQGTDDTRRRAHVAELRGHIADERIVDLVMERLLAGRLVSVEEDYVEITHEALLEYWPRLHDWIEADRQALLLRQQLGEAAQAWAGGGRDPELLYGGSRLARVQEWTADKERRAELTDGEAAFLQASVQRERRRVRRLYQVISALALLFMLSASGGGLALQQRAEAIHQQNVAIGKELAAESSALRDSQPRLSLLLAMEAMRVDPAGGARSALLATLMSTHYSGTLTGHSDAVRAVAFSPDGRTLATGSNDGTAILWDVGPRPARIATLVGDRPIDKSSATAVVFSPDGRTLAAANGGESVILWDVSDRRHPVRETTLRGHTDAVSTAAFSPDGRTLATGSWDRTTILWDLTERGNPVRLSTLIGHRGWVESVTFGPNGRTMATGSADHTAMVWDVGDRVHPNGLATLGGHTDAVSAVALSPDGGTLAVGSWDHTTALWDLGDPAHPARVATLAAHTAGVSAAAFGAGGRTLATSSHDGTAVVWDLSDRARPERLLALSGHIGPVFDVAFSPDGATVATAGWDHTSILWRVRDRANPVRIATFSNDPAAIVTHVAFSRDGRTLATAGGAAAVWDVSDHTQPTRLASLGSLVTLVAISADGRTLATGSGDGTVRLWDLADPAHPAGLSVLGNQVDAPLAMAFNPSQHVLAVGSRNEVFLWDLTDRGRPARLAAIGGETRYVWSVAFSPDGRTLARGGETPVLWDVSKPARPARVAALLGPVEAADFSRSGQSLVTGGAADGSAVLWDVGRSSDPVRLATFRGHGSDVTSVAFSPDGRSLVTAGADGNAILWDVADRGHPVRLATLGHTSPLFAVAYSPDGRTVATGSRDASAGLWDVSAATSLAAHAVAAACSMPGAALSRTEWTQYVPQEPYAPICL